MLETPRTAPGEVLELMDRLYEALHVADVATLRELIAEDVEARFAPGLPLGLGDAPYVGREDLLRRGWGRVTELLRIVPHPERVALAGGWVVVRGRYLGSSRTTGRPLDARFAHLWRLRGGRVVQLRQITDTAAWWDAMSPAPMTRRAPLPLARGHQRHVPAPSRP